MAKARALTRMFHGSERKSLEAAAGPKALLSRCVPVLGSQILVEAMPAARILTSLDIGFGHSLL